MAARAPTAPAGSPCGVTGRGRRHRSSSASGTGPAPLRSSAPEGPGAERGRKFTVLDPGPPEGTGSGSGRQSPGQRAHPS